MNIWNCIFGDNAKVRLSFSTMANPVLVISHLYAEAAIYDWLLQLLKFVHTKISRLTMIMNMPYDKMVTVKMALYVFMFMLTNINQAMMILDWRTITCTMGFS